MLKSAEKTSAQQLMNITPSVGQSSDHSVFTIWNSVPFYWQKKPQLWNMKLFKQKTDFIPQESTLLMQKQLKTEKCKRIFSHFSSRNVFLHFILLNKLTTCDGSGDRTSDLVVSTVSAGGANRISAAERVFQLLHTQTEKRWSSQKRFSN